MLVILRNLLSGICIGIANIIPGVSGSTVAVILNIYDKFVEIFNFNLKKIWKNRKFSIPLLLGMLTGIVLFSKIIKILYGNYPVQTNYFFTGLIIGSIPLLFKYIIAKKNKEEKFSAGKIIAIVLCITAGIAVMLWMGYMESKIPDAEVTGELPPLTWPLVFKIFAAGVLGAVAMIMPGISGALIMLIMGVYLIVTGGIDLMITSFFKRDWQEMFRAIITILPNGIGVLAGLALGSRVIAYLLKKFPNQSYALIFGLIIASAINIFPGFTFKSPLQGVASIICLLIGVVLAYLSSKLAPEENKDKEKTEEISQEQKAEEIKK